MTIAISAGNFFEDFRLGERLRHGAPRTLTDGDISAYIALTGCRNPIASATTVANALGHPDRPIDAWLLFNMAFGKTVPEVSLNAMANLGYAECRFHRAVYPGDTIRCESDVIGLRETSAGDAGIVWVRSFCLNQRAEPVLEWVRWVLVRKRTPSRSNDAAQVPTLHGHVAADALAWELPPSGALGFAALAEASGSQYVWEDYSPGDRIDHPSAMTIEEADHMSATRLFQNNAQVHFDALAMRETKIGRRLVYGGYVISICQSLARSGLDNVMAVAAINGGTHRSPVFAGDTICAVTQVQEQIVFPDRSDIGLLRLRLVGAKNVRARDIDLSASNDSSIVLDLDYTVVIPRRHN